MKTINMQYKGRRDLYDFIEKNQITSCKNILLQIFTGICDALFIEELISQIKERIPHINIIGTTTSGEILDDMVMEASTVLSFSLFESTQIHIYGTDRRSDSVSTTQNLIAMFDPYIEPKVAIAFAEGLKTNGESVMDVFHDYDENLTVAGGLAGDNHTFSGTMVFTHEGLFTDGIVVALLCSDTLQVSTDAIFGWESIGKTMTVTKSVKNRVYEIDGKRAVDIYAKYLGEDIVSGLPAVGINFPMIVKRGNIEIPRAVLQKHEDGSLSFAGNPNCGDRVTFGYGNVEKILKLSDKVRQGITSCHCDAIFVYSCAARKDLLGAEASVELDHLFRFAPLCGLFTYGEFYTRSKDHAHYLLNETMTTLSLREGDGREILPLDDAVIRTYTEKEETGNLILKALSHLISQTTKELEDMNRDLEIRVSKEVQKNREKESQMLYQARLAQMGELIAMIAHQWRQPLNAISITSNNILLKLLKEEDKIEQEFLREEISLIEGYSQHLSSTIDDFRGFFKKNKTKKRSIPSKIALDTISIIEPSLKYNNIEIISHFKDDVELMTFPNQVKQVILNLIKNAEESILEREIEAPKINIEVLYKEQQCFFVVRDNAGGISDEIILKIFEPYFSTKHKKDGTGLGLYMSKIIVEDHCGGELTVANNKEGAVFTIRLPL